MNRRPKVAVVGAGPVGLTAALTLARAAVPVTVLERGPALSAASKASTFHPATLELLDELAVADSLVRIGRRVDSIQWRAPEGRLLSELPYRALEGLTRFPHRLHVEQSRLTPLLLERLRALPDADVRFEATVCAVDQSDTYVRIWTQDASGDRAALEADFLIAADGAHSTVRESLGLPDQAVSYPSYALRVVTDTPLDLYLSDLSGVCYVRGTEQSLSLLGMPDHWRLIFRIPQSVPRARAIEPGFVRDVLRRGLPGLAERINVVDAHTYRLAAFVLPDYRHGRVLFAGDAAHLTSTAGGLNMNCGLHDAVAWGRAVAAVLDGRQPEEHLTRVAAERRSVAADRVLPRSEARTAGLDRAEGLRAALAQIERIAADPALTADYLVKASLLDCAPPRAEQAAHSATF